MVETTKMPARTRAESDPMHTDPLSWWPARFSETAPVGHHLRAKLRAQWVRFHSLPESKRYAESPAEHAELQARHLAVASTLFSTDEPLYVYRAHLVEERLRGRKKHHIAGRQFKEQAALLPTCDEPIDGERWHVRALVTRWRPDFFEASVRLMADWQAGGVSFVSPATSNIFYPYDGGMDVFAFSIHPDELRARFPGWLSPHPSGL